MRLKKAGLLTALIALLFCLSFAGAETLQACHRVTNTAKTSTQGNKSQVRLWHAETAHPAVTEEINGIAEAWAEEMGPSLPKAVNWFRNETYYIYEKEGIRIAFFALDNSKFYSLRKKLAAMFSELRESKGVNAIVVCIHTGMEYRGKHDKDAADKANTLVASGADLVIMHHPHVLQGVEIINNRTVFYSMGNFVFGGNNAIKTKVYSKMTVTSLYTMAVQVKMSFANDGTYLGQQATIYPAQSSSDPVVNYYP